MQEFKCAVRSADGKMIHNYKVKAEDTTDLMAKLKNSGLYLVRMQETQAGKDIVQGMKLKLSTKDIAMLCRQLSSMLMAGVTLVKALNILYLQMDKKNIKETVRKLYESVQKGEMFSDALRKQGDIYPELMISMVEAGEGSGKLDSVMAKLAAYYEKDVKLRAKIKSSMMYPMILLALTIGAIILLVAIVFPTFATIFQESGMSLPLPTKIVMAFSNALTGYWYLFIIGIGIIVFSIKVYLSSEKGLRKWHKTMLKIPVLGKTVTKIAAVRFASTLGTLLSSGMNLMNALDISIRVTGNRVVMDGLYDAKEDIRKGMPMSQALRKTNVLPPMVYSMIGIGEESGSIEDMLNRCSEYFDEEVDSSITRLVGLLEPILIIFMALVIGFVVVSMLLPMFGLYEIVSAG